MFLVATSEPFKSHKTPNAIESILCSKALSKVVQNDSNDSPGRQNINVEPVAIPFLLANSRFFLISLSEISDLLIFFNTEEVNV